MNGLDNKVVAERNAHTFLTRFSYDLICIIDFKISHDILCGFSRLIFILLFFEILIDSGFLLTLTLQYV